MGPPPSEPAFDFALGNDDDDDLLSPWPALADFAPPVPFFAAEPYATDILRQLGAVDEAEECWPTWPLEEVLVSPQPEVVDNAIAGEPAPSMEELMAGLLDTLAACLPQPPASCKRKRQAPDSEIWPTPAKRARCADVASTSSPDPTFAALPPRSYSSSYEPVSSSSSSAPSPASSPSSAVPAPIVIVPEGGLCCPMPGCGATLSAKDSAWRGHFRSAHHADLCGDADCAGGCKRACPFPLAGKCGKQCGTPMAVDSVGRHLLNVHVGVRHRCPVCGVEKAQRYSACQRHILTCLQKHGMGAGAAAER
ncbi:hypothetical protein C8Q77DRAFT_1110322 [Trametes polyzona]|nr:hypothetical protein C8Q77DRAFT_1110322 [Trametes polyzona]